MRVKFSEYYQPSESDLKDMWKEGIFVFDANVLLDLHRFSEDTVNSIMSIFENIKDRIWIPYQASKEYHNNLCSVIKEQCKNYESSIRNLIEFKKQIEMKNCHPFLNKSEQEEICSICNKYEKILKDKQDEVRKKILTNNIKEALADLLENKIGDELTAEEINEIIKQGEVRYKNRIPPGYKDQDKQNPEKYGDLIIWKEILKKNKDNNKPIIFITRDTKEDWFINEMGYTVGLRTELIKEFRGVNSNLIYGYTLDRFLKYASEYIENTKIEEKSIEEVINYIKNIGLGGDNNEILYSASSVEGHVSPNENQVDGLISDSDNSSSIDE